jgi:hypothetical protein
MNPQSHAKVIPVGFWWGGRGGGGEVIIMAFKEEMYRVFTSIDIRMRNLDEQFLFLLA